MTSGQGRNDKKGSKIKKGHPHLNPLPYRERELSRLAVLIAVTVNLPCNDGTKSKITAGSANFRNDGTREKRRGTEDRGPRTKYRASDGELLAGFDDSVLQTDYPVYVFLVIWLMGYHDDCLGQFFIQFLEQFEDDFCGGCIQACRWFIGE